MKKVQQIFLVGILFLAFITSGFSVHTAVMDKGAITTYLEQYSPNADEFINLRAKDIRKATDQKLTFRDRIVLNLTKFKVATEVRKNAELNPAEYYQTANRRFNLGGFLLGLFLPIIGNLLAILFGRNAFRSSLYGTLVFLILALFGLILN